MKPRCNRYGEGPEEVQRGTGDAVKPHGRILLEDYVVHVKSDRSPEPQNDQQNQTEVQNQGTTSTVKEPIHSNDTKPGINGLPPRNRFTLGIAFIRPMKLQNTR